MLYRIFGRAGSGKTEYMLSCLKDMQSTGVDCLFLVPEQQSLAAELMLERAGAAHINTEVLNFERLPNRVFREIGGVHSTAVDKTGKCVLIAAAVNRLGNRLKLFGRLGRGILNDLCETIGALKRLCVTPDYLEQLCTELEAKGADTGFTEKLREVALIYGQYQQLLGNTLQDDNDPLTRLALAEDTHGFFRGKAVFLDGMYTYTPQQYRIIEIMAQSAAALYVSFTADEDEGGVFDGTMDCARIIKKLAGGKCKDVFLTANHRAKVPELTYGEAALWAGGTPYGEYAPGIELACCESRYEEALYAASRIYALRSQGFRFDQIAIAVRDTESYAGVLDAVLAGYNIPFYFASKDSAATKPLTAFVLALLEMARDNMPLSAVKKYLKTTFSVLSDEDVDVLVRYGESWDIHGKTWLSTAPWLMHPHGYSADFSAAAEAQLNRINSAKEAFALSVAPVVQALQGPDLTVGAAVNIIYNHMVECGAADKLAAAADKLTKLGDADSGAKTAALWGVMVDMLDRLHSLAGDVATTAGDMLLLMEAMAESCDIGAIPSYTDAVNIGDARLMRADGIKAMIILGVNDGVFPSLPVKSGVFSAKESTVLGQAGVELLPDTDKAVNEERFFFYNCASAPSHHLYVSHITGGERYASPLFKGLCAMFPHNSVLSFGANDTDYMFCRKAAFDRLPYIKNAAVKARLKQALCVDPSTAALIENAPPIKDASAYVRESTLQLLTLSYSKIDCYNNCGFHYLMRYKLHLKNNRRLGFNAMDSGTYMHHLMELYMKKRMETGSFVPADREETVAEIAAITKDYLQAIMPQKPKKRLLKLIDRLQNAAVFVCESLNQEFSSCGFAPQGFEVRIGAGGIAPPVLVTEKGRRVTTVGSIDRVDTAVVDGKTYARVADYKSKKHSISKKHAQYGEKLQMLSYLFTYCNATGTAPAGVLYRSFDLPVDGKMPSQTGMVTDNAAVLDQMDDGARRLRNKLTDAEFEELKEQVYSHIKGTADLITDGVMCAVPYKKRTQSCEFCDYGEVCRMQKPKPKF